MSFKIESGLRVMQVPNEPTRYRVESSSLECPSCLKLFSRRDWKHKHTAVGDSCPLCGAGTLDVRFHLVDLSCYRPIGQCTCEHFNFRLQSQLGKLSPSSLRTMTQGEAAKLRCTHIEAARALALDLTVEQHEKQRHAGAGRQVEGVGA